MKMSMEAKNKIVIMALAVFMAISLTACSGRSGWPIFGGPNYQGEDDTPFTSKAHTGLYGLVLKFTNSNPPRTVYYSGPGTPFDVILEMRNRGAEDVIGGYIYLSGYDRNIIEPGVIGHSDFPNVPIRFDLEGVTNFNPEGGYTTIEFQNTIQRWPEGVDQYEPNFRVSACYEYRTIANPVVCIDPHPYSALEEKKVCRVRNIAMAGGQGAPIEVSSIEEEATESFVYFRIHVKNSQTRGVVYDPLRVDYNPDGPSCPFNLQYQDITKIYYYPPVFTGSGDYNPTLVECKPGDPIPGENGGVRYPVRLVDNRAIIYCKYSIPSTLNEVYQTPLSIIFDYGYLDYEEQKISIRNVADG